MEEAKMTLEEMISALDEACGRLLAAARFMKPVEEAMKMITSVSIALGEVNELRYADYGETEGK